MPILVAPAILGGSILVGGIGLYYGGEGVRDIAISACLIAGAYYVYKRA